MNDVKLSNQIGEPSNWLLDPEITFLNHGSFGACPVSILEAQQQFRMELERQPIQFMIRDRPKLLDESRQVLAEFLNTPASDIVFVQNATTGVNSVLGSLKLNQGDELLTTNHSYNACKNAMHSVAEKASATVVVAEVPFPLSSSSEIIEAVLECITSKTRLVMLDHISSSTAIIFPLKELVKEIQGRGIDVLVDGAHAPGLIDLSLSELGAAYYTGNCHKWMCAPKGAAFLYVRPDRQNEIQPAVISHGFNTPQENRSRMQTLFDWTGTSDPSPFLCIPHAINFINTLMPCGWKELAERNHQLAVAARQKICEKLKIEAPVPENMIAALATIPLPDDDQADIPDCETEPTPTNRLQTRLYDEHQIEVPVFHFPETPKRWLRVSANAYNSIQDYEKLGDALEHIL